ncbi:MAG: phenylacetate--CoA ligase family protein [Betaproteobacteria bacterium]|nr:phenylacetate--CoA ligase family protein [Betaproteobacteria bacterium]
MTRHPAPPFDGWAWMQAYNETTLANLDRRTWGWPLRERRLAALMDVAQRDSPLYRRRWGGAGALAELEPVTKTELMRDFDDWATDRAITREGAEAILADPEALSDAWLGRYLVWSSSGTSGEPGIFVQDAASLAAYDAIDTLRLRGPAHPMGLWGIGRRFAYVGATGGHFAGVASVERLRRLAWAPWAPRMEVFSVLTPLPALAEALQAMSPQVLVTYPSCAVALAALQQAGDLHLRLDELWLGGEQLSAAQRLVLGRSFACPVRNNYGASECYSIACACPLGQLHLNDDWVVLETLDRQGRPVAPGEDAHTVALTNLANRTQPLLRYVLTDSVRFLATPCACGSRFPAIEVQGRADDTLVLPAAGGRRAVLLPLALETVIEEAGGVTQFQLLQLNDHTLELRLAPGSPGSPLAADPAAACARCTAALQNFLQQHGVQGVHILRGHQGPCADALSGKLRRVIALPGSPSTPAPRPAAQRRAPASP